MKHVFIHKNIEHSEWEIVSDQTNDTVPKHMHVLFWYFYLFVANAINYIL
jgi:hypothetical protein